MPFRGAATVVAYLEREPSLTGRIGAAVGLEPTSVSAIVGWLLTTAEFLRVGRVPRATGWRGAIVLALRERVIMSEHEPTSELAAQEAWIRLAPWLEAVSGPLDVATPGVAIDSGLASIAAVWQGTRAQVAAHAAPGVLATASWIGGLHLLGEWLGPKLGVLPEVSDRAGFDRVVSRAVQVVEDANVLTRPLQGADSLAQLAPELVERTPLGLAVGELELVPGPAIYLIEAPPGAPKIDAALGLAARLLAQGDGDRLLVVRPWSGPVAIEPRRIDRAVQRLFVSPERILRSSGRLSRRDWFKQVTTSTSPGSDSELGESIEGWMGEERRRAWMSPCGTVPLEEAALAVLPAPLTALRSLALGRSVIVVDQLVASDSYGHRCLLTLLDTHTRLGGSAVVTSTVLTRELHRRLAEAVAPEPEGAQRLDRGSYPRITTFSLEDRRDRGFLHDTTPFRVKVIEDKGSAVALLVDAVKAGRCACWIRSSVEGVHDAVQRLATQVPEDRLHIFHERFVDGDRAELELELAARFGPEGSPEARAGRLVVASPAVTRGVDVHFDVVLSDLAPIDALLERAGHTLNVPAPDDDPRLLHVLAPPFTDNPPADWVAQAMPTLAATYRDQGVLWLTLRALRSLPGGLYPEDYRGLADQVLGETAHELVPWALWNTHDPTGAAASPARLQRLTPVSPTTPRRSWAMMAHDASPGPGVTELTALRLARRTGGTLLPLVASVSSGWDQSRLLVPRVLAVRRASAEFDAEVAVAAMLMPDRGRWALTVVMTWEPSTQRWVGEVVGEDGKARRLGYDRTHGLVFSEPVPDSLTQDR